MAEEAKGFSEEDAVISLQGVGKLFGDHWAVSDFDLRIPRGMTYGLLGPNGAGKTTSLRMIYGLTEPTSGSLRVFGKEVRENVRAVRARLGVTLQENVLIENLNPRENLAVFGRFHLLRGQALRDRIEFMIDFLELRSHADMPVRALSGGYKRRLAVAMSLMNDPELVILDEPTTGLDPAVRLALWERVRELRASGKTVVLTTHYMDEAERLCDRVAIMSEGKCVMEGVPSELITRHLAREAIEFDCSVKEEGEFLLPLEVPRARVRVGRRLMLYADDTGAYMDRLHQREGADCRPFIVRPTNLEDLFLSVTGTSLEEAE
jgi:lipooligosaccharide transport system ATP-binding protein